MNDAFEWGKEKVNEGIEYVKENPGTAAAAGAGALGGFALGGPAGAAGGAALGAAAAETISRSQKSEG